MSGVQPKSVARELLDLSAPIIGVNVLNVLALAIDTAMCGRLPNHEAALTALGFATQVIFLLMVAMIGLSVGTVATIARAYGAREHDHVNHIMQQSTMLTMLLSAVVAVVGNLSAPFILRALGAQPESLELGLSYLRPLLTCTVFYYLTILYGATLRGVGNTRLPFVAALGATVINIFVNYGLILGNYGLPSLGVLGAAIGTVTSQAFSCVFLVIMIRRGAIPHLKLPLKIVGIHGADAKNVVRIGLPAGVDMVILNAGFLALVGMLGRIDEVTIAAHGIGLRIQALAFVPGMSVSQATGAMVGQALGSGDVDRAKRVVRASVFLSTGIMSSLALLIIIGVNPIVALFEVDPASTLGKYSVTWIELLGYGMPIVGVYIALVGMLQGAGETKRSLRINFVATLIQIPLGAFLGFGMNLGAWGVWASFPLSFSIKLILGAIEYFRGRWAKVGVIPR